MSTTTPTTTTTNPNPPIAYCDKPGSRDRIAFLVFVKDGIVIPFEGQSIPKVCAILSERFRKDGKWSNTSYSLALADGVVAINGHSGWATGLMSDGVATATKLPANSWAELAVALGATRESTEEWLRKRAPRTSGVLDERDAALKAL